MRALLAILLLSLTARAATLLPDERTMPWGRTNVGVLNGIPVVTNVFTNIYPSGGDDGDILRGALLDCPSNQVVRLWPGRYTVSGQLDYLTIGSGKVLRGSGQNRTIITFTNAFPAGAYVRGSEFSEEALTNAVDLASDAIKGTNVLMLASIPSWVVAGGHYILDQIGDTNLVYGFGTSENENPASGYRENMIFSLLGRRESRGMGQMVKVTSVTSSNVTLEQPITFTYNTSQTAQLAQSGYDPSTQSAIRRVGFEDLTFEANYTSSDADIFRIENAEDCWIQNVTMTNTPGMRHVQFTFSYRCEVRTSIMRDSHLYSAGRGYGIAYYHLTTACLVEDNIFGHLHAPISYDYGANCNVSAYNMLLAGFSDANQNPSITTHGVHCYGNLNEGNYMVDKALMDWSHGSASHNTLFRNRILGYDGVHTEDQIPVVIEFYNRTNSVVGNILGVTGYHTNYSAEATNDVCSSSTRDIYHGGYFTYGCGVGTVFDSPAVTATLLAVNWTAATSTNSGIALGGYTTNSVPTSMIYASRPSWWTGRWPAYDPTMGGTASHTNIPAGFRWFSITNATPAVVINADATQLIIQ